MQPGDQHSDGVEVLTAAECRMLLAGAAVGRIGFTTRAMPAIMPVPFAMREGEVVVPAVSGGQLASACRDAVVAFEVDSCEVAGTTAWAVTVVGHSRVVTAADEVAALDRLGLAAWAPPVQDCYIAVQAGRVTGWRVSRPDSHQDIRAASAGDEARASAQ
jgi:hypothetical protein